MIPYGKQDINQTDIDAVINVLKSDYLTQGPKVPEFEQAISQYVGAVHAVAVNSATSALHIACLALNIGEGDIVWTSPITFVASANCALYCGAKIDFVDIDPITGNMCPKALAQKLKIALKEGQLPKVVIPVHMAGHSCDMQAINQLLTPYNIHIIEDASHAIGGQYQQTPIGQCQYSDITIFSFHPVKIITSAEGGMATTNDQNLADSMRLLRSHGITKQPEKMLRSNEGDWYYEQHQLGMNYRMTDLNAALGLSQLVRVDEFVAQRNRLAQAYHSCLNGLAIEHVSPLSDSYSARHLHIIRLGNASKRRMIFDAMRAAGIQVHVHYFPVHLQPYYLNLGFKAGDFKQAEQFYEQILTLPLYPELTTAQLEYICATLKGLLE
ncbi:UDP-4-amino-4,6-dideoxy-N-acetyl-beta-L-altrosamine transaminase [Shewanella aestuarii]|uniref:UDP-4-amino-4, 6-dideoxy-N-acetyl-beta-L-altrosamine transaminase n=1 Tax=Shewanella aestuarii TaxID=1028752 RepID=A0A6G9QIR7_9GAMM|nr:UDP-4-amino-4,6-dideoxy-N-acetyl-beta-L-altrosamine transaminase [Shewanella aestuarii]QIR13957.1 UDP-4-amino-4,6-dideoxy-N-acetyl-beta-L-altrosamine transaminase [Shewanella aestuarii]